MTAVMDALALLTPYDIDRPKIRIGPPTDGGYVFADRLVPAQTIVSYGISTEYRFDAEMAARGHRVFMFDHTIDGIQATHRNMLWFKEGVAGASAPGQMLYSIEDHLKRHAIAGNDLILKMDVEGAEWEALDACPDETLARFEQIVIEVHALNAMADPVFRAQFTEVMRKLNRHFILFHVHANNCDGQNGLSIVAGMPVSALLELSYVRRDVCRAAPSRTLYPTSLDYPNVPAPEKLLWFFPFLPTTAPLDAFRMCYDRVDALEARRTR